MMGRNATTIAAPNGIRQAAMKTVTQLSAVVSVSGSHWSTDPREQIPLDQLPRLAIRL